MTTYWNTECNRSADKGWEDILDWTITLIAVDSLWAYELWTPYSWSTSSLLMNKQPCQHFRSCQAWLSMRYIMVLFFLGYQRGPFNDFRASNSNISRHWVPLQDCPSLEAARVSAQSVCFNARKRKYLAAWCMEVRTSQTKVLLSGLPNDA